MQARRDSHIGVDGGSVQRRTDGCRSTLQSLNPQPEHRWRFPFTAFPLVHNRLARCVHSGGELSLTESKSKTKSKELDGVGCRNCYAAYCNGTTDTAPVALAVLRLCTRFTGGSRR